MASADFVSPGSFQGADMQRCKKSCGSTSTCESFRRKRYVCDIGCTPQSDVVFLHAVSDWVVEVQLSPVVCVHAVSVLLFDAAAAAAPLGPPLLVHQADHHSQRAHGYEDHCSDHTWKRRRESTLDDGCMFSPAHIKGGITARLVSD